MTRPRTIIGWIAVVAVLLVILAIAAVQQPRASDTEGAGGASSAPSTAGTASADTARATAQPRPSANVEPASPSASTLLGPAPLLAGVGELTIALIGLVPGHVMATKRV
jgi:hypothetical protein